jgi:hypothetical protein
MNRLLSVLLGACLAATTAGAVDTITRVLNLEHISVSEASAAVQPLLSESGSLTIQPSRSRVTVQDVPAVVEKVTELIAEMDRAPGLYRIHVELLQGTSEPYSSGQPAAQIDPRLRKMFDFPTFHHLAGTTLEGEVGSAAAADLGSRFQISFQPDAIEYSPDTPWGAPHPGDRINLRHVVLTKIGVDANGVRTSTALLQTSMMLSANQKVYIGAGSSEDADSGLVLIVHALETGVR